MLVVEVLAHYPSIEDVRGYINILSNIFVVISFCELIQSVQQGVKKMVSHIKVVSAGTAKMIHV